MNDLNVMASTCSGGRRALFGIGASLGHGESGVAGEHGGKDEGEGDGSAGRGQWWVGPVGLYQWAAAHLGSTCRLGRRGPA